jgi:hypothetical protein
LRQHVRQRLQIEVQERVKWPFPLGRLAWEYNAGASHNGPASDSFLLDWHCAGVTPWTQDCITIITHDFLGQVAAGVFPNLHETIGFEKVSSAVRDYVTHLKKGYTAAISSPHTAAVAKQRLEKRSRSLNRRQQVRYNVSRADKWLISCQLLGRRISLLKHHYFPEDAVEMVNALDIDGMSSEDSDGELGTERKFHIKKLPWRSEDLTAWLHRIDGMPTKNISNHILKSRRYLRTRFPSDLVTDRRGPVASLPQNLYRREWLEGQGLRALKRLGVREDIYLLPKIDEFAP